MILNFSGCQFTTNGTGVETRNVPFSKDLVVAHSVEITNFYSHSIFSQKLRETNFVH